MAYVTDTHCLIWHLTEDNRLSNKAKYLFLQADESSETIFVSCISFMELIFLLEKKRVSIEFDKFANLFTNSDYYRIEPICLPIIENVRKISREEVKDPWDRIIAATSMHLKLPLISRDRNLGKLKIDIVN